MMTPQIVFVLLSYDTDRSNPQFHGIVANEQVADAWAAVDPKHRTALDWEVGKIDSPNFFKDRK